MGKENLNSQEINKDLGPKQIVFVRHAESVRNAAKGHNVRFPDENSLNPVKGIPSYETPLSEEGILQAKQLGLNLIKRFGYFDIIYQSGYRSALQTLEGIQSAHQENALTCPKVVQDFLIRERDQGFVFNMHDEEINNQFPWLRDYWQTFGRFLGKSPGSENLAEVAQRARYFLDDLFRYKPEKSVLVITHAGTLQAFRFLMESWTYQQANSYMENQMPGNCAVVAYGSLDPNEQLSIGSESPSFIDLGHHSHRNLN